MVDGMDWGGGLGDWEGLGGARMGIRLLSLLVVLLVMRAPALAFFVDSRS